MMEITPAQAEIFIQVASGDVDKLAKLHEICSWCPTRVILYKKSLEIALAAMKEEEAWMIKDRALPIENSV